MRIHLHSHAFVHGLSEKQIYTAFETGSLDARIRRRDRDADPPRWGLIGFDDDARAIELVCVELMDGGVIVIHANYLTARFEREMRNAR